MSSSANLSNEELAVLIKNGAKEYTPILWEQTHLFLFSQMNKYYKLFGKYIGSCGLTLEDLNQECFIIMLNMVKAFKPEKEYSFLSYTNFQLKSYLYGVILKIRPKKDDFQSLNEVRPNPLNHCVSIYNPLGENEDFEIIDTIVDNSAEADFESVDNAVYNIQLHNVLQQAMDDSLTDTQKRVIIDRYFNGQTLDCIASETGLCRESIRQTEKKALKRLKEHHEKTSCFESYHEELIEKYAYRNTGLFSFRRFNGSSVEIATEKVGQKMAMFRKNHEKG